ncbi:UDP-galactose transporter [Mucidula mucida]|nr:UDP-galactose transporter [Mucidula mucida]
MSFLRSVSNAVRVLSLLVNLFLIPCPVSVPFKSIDDGSSAKFHSAIFLGTCQSALSSLSALIYILFRRNPSATLAQNLGLEPAPIPASNDIHLQTNGSAKHHANGSAKHPDKPSTRYSHRALLLRYLQCAAFITAAAPFGFAALSYITYPAMVLGKSCKLVPVMIMNVLLYRRKFAPHKYLVVFMVTAGITVFMYMGNEKKRKSSSGPESTSPYANIIGITYLLVNLALDGAIFVRHKVTGQQMMFWINVMCTGITTVLSLLPFLTSLEMLEALSFIRAHPSIITPLLQFSITGALGQLFIFETLQHFGSLTLVTITLTRKLFTMLLSVVVYKHSLTPGQWLGAGIVFAGISVEAFVKRKDVHAKRVIQEKEKAKLKAL